MTQAMSLFLVDALYRLSLVRRYPEFIIGSLNVLAYALGGYYATKYTVRLAPQKETMKPSRHKQLIL
jgi:hypothetical protein